MAQCCCSPGGLPGCCRVPAAPGSCREGDHGRALWHGSSVQGLEGKGKAPRRALASPVSPPGRDKPISGLDSQCLNRVGGSKGPGKGQQEPGPAGKGELPEIPAHNFFLLQSVPLRSQSWAAGVETHALPCGAAETTRNIPLHALVPKRNMMQRKYCPNLYWNLFLIRLTTQTPRKTKGYRTHVDGEQGELYNGLK